MIRGLAIAAALVAAGPGWAQAPAVPFQPLTGPQPLLGGPSLTGPGPGRLVPSAPLVVPAPLLGDVPLTGRPPSPCPVGARPGSAAVASRNAASAARPGFAGVPSQPEIPGEPRTPSEPGIPGQPAAAPPIWGDRPLVPQGAPTLSGLPAPPSAQEGSPQRAAIPADRPLMGGTARPAC